MKETYFLGIDGGGTSCRARLCDSQGKTLGEGLSGSANVRLGLDVVYGSIMSATQEALQMAGLPLSVLGHTYAGFGLAGAVSEVAKESVRNHAHHFAGVAIETDAHTACLGAHGGKDGGILIIGTGSCGVACVDGLFSLIGGWGLMVSDHASGAQLGLRALRYALQAHEGVVPVTVLSKRLMAQFNHSAIDVLSWVEQARPCDYASFAPQIIEHAAEKDLLAVDLLNTTAVEATAMIERLQSLGAKNICLMGGLSEVLRQWLPLEINNTLTGAQGDAMDGAILLAQQQFERGC